MVVFVFHHSLGHGDCRTVIQRSGLSGRGQFLPACHVKADLVIIHYCATSHIIPDVFLYAIFLFVYIKMVSPRSDKQKL